MRNADVLSVLQVPNSGEMQRAFFLNLNSYKIVGLYSS